MLAQGKHWHELHMVDWASHFYYDWNTHSRVLQEFLWKWIKSAHTIPYLSPCWDWFWQWDQYTQLYIMSDVCMLLGRERGDGFNVLIQLCLPIDWFILKCKRTIVAGSKENKFTGKVGHVPEPRARLHNIMTAEYTHKYAAANVLSTLQKRKSFRNKAESFTNLLSDGVTIFLCMHADFLFSK